MCSYVLFAFLFFSGSLIYNIEAITKFAKDALDASNEYRAAHGSPPLIWNSSIAEYACKYARNLAINGVIKHNPHTQYGENIYYMRSSSLDAIEGRRPILSWYNEIQNYDFENPGILNKSSHFTQLIWKNSIEVGIAFVTTNELKTWVVAYFSPKGNTPKKFRENVSPRIVPPSTTNNTITAT